MFDFQYFTPTKVVFGKNSEQKVADLVREFGGKKVLIHYGGGSVIRSGLLKRVTDSLEEAGISYVTLGGAPRASSVDWGGGAPQAEPSCAVSSKPISDQRQM